MSKERPTEAEWEGFLTGEMRGLDRSRRIFARSPSTPRCKLCAAPYGAPGGPILKLFGGGPSPLNRRLCRWCIGKLENATGGAEVEVSILFADVRGSTTLAERMPPGEFSALLARFYGIAARVVDRWDGIVDKFVGDEAIALFIPGFAGQDHAARAVAAAQDLLEATGHADATPWLPVGIGVHSGVSYVGFVGEDDALDFTAVGDTVNTAARLSKAAGAGEVLVSDETATAGALDTEGLEHRVLELRGREQTVGAWVRPLVVPA